MLRIAICDDSKVDCAIITEFLGEYVKEKALSVEIKTFDHPDAMLSECEKFRPHIYILDIIMPMVTGIEAARELRWSQKESQIIFTTADPAYALESFDVNPVNYLLKPVIKEKLFESLDICVRHAIIEDETNITVKVRGGYETVRTSDILYLDYRNHIVTYHLLDDRTITTTTLRIGFAEYLKNTFEDDGPMQCHESVAVNIAKIDKLMRDSILLVNQEIIPVSKSKYKSVAARYLGKEE